MIKENFTIKVNKDAKRYEFHSRNDLLNSYTVGFHEVDTLEDACIAVYKAVKIDVKTRMLKIYESKFMDLFTVIGKSGLI